MLVATAWLAATWLGVRARRRRRAATSAACSPAGTPQATAGKRAGGSAVIDITATASATQLPAPPAPAIPAPQLPHSIRFICSLDLTPADVARLEAELVGARNRFVCLLCHQMAKEQLEAVQALRAAPPGPAADAQHARLAAQHFAVLEAGEALVAAAFFYPRSTSTAKGGSRGGAAPAPACANDDGSARTVVAGAGGALLAAAEAPSAVDPHAYVELLCCCQPGAGWGSALLAAVERFAVQHARGALAVRGRPLRAVKLLSVGSAEAFYRRCGYGEPDQHREMAKPLQACR